MEMVLERTEKPSYVERGLIMLSKFENAELLSILQGNCELESP